MKQFLLYFFIVGIICSCYSQQFGNEIIIYDDSNAVNAITTLDIDSDGDNDVFATASDAIRWFNNLDGNGNFSNENIILENPGQSFSIEAIDIDSDGDLDILSSFFDTDRVAWFENEDGMGNFGAIQIISSTTERATRAFAADLDGDDDMDIVVTTNSLNNGAELITIENMDGSGNFGNQTLVTNALINGRDVQLADADGDGDIDIFASSSAPETGYWFENDGSANFTNSTLVSNDGTAGVETLVVSDYDGDGDLDIAVGMSASDTIAWYENIDGDGTYSNKIVVSQNSDFVRDMQAIDVDNDGDMDLIATNAAEGTLSWYENLDGLGDFSDKQLIGNVENSRVIAAGDLDGDGDMDVLGGTRRVSGINDIVWFPNREILGIDESSIADITIYPNPTSGLLHVNSIEKDYKIVVYDILGRKLPITRESHNTIDLNSLTKGIYFVEILGKDGGKVLKKVIKE